MALKKTRFKPPVYDANGVASYPDTVHFETSADMVKYNDSNVASELSNIATEVETKADKLKVATIEKELNDYQKTLAQVNVNQEAKQSVTGYGVVSLPKNTANGQVSAVVKGNTITNKAGIGDTSPQTITLDSTKTYLLIKTDGGTVNIDGVDTAVPTKITSKASTTLTWTTGKIGMYELLSTETGLAIDLAKKYTYVTNTKSTISAGRLKSVNKNQFNMAREFEKLPLWSRVSIGEYKNKRTLDSIQARFTYASNLYEVNQQYTISYDILSPTGINLRFGFKYTDGTTSGPSVLSNGQYQNVTHTSVVGKTVSEIFVTRSANPTADTVRVKNFQLERGVATPYEPYTESTKYFTAKDSNGNIVELRSLPNGTKDEIRVSGGKAEHIKRVGIKLNVASGTVINYADMSTGGQFVARASDGTTQTGVKGDSLTITAVTLTYQLATPIETPIEVSGTLLSYPSGTIYVENAVADAGIYTDKFTILQQDLPIKEIEKISKVDFTTGLETELDVSTAVIAVDELSFTHPNLTANDIVFTTYFYDKESTQGEMTVEYYDSRHVLKDSVTGKFYKIVPTVADGVLTNGLVEV